MPSFVLLFLLNVKSVCLALRQSLALVVNALISRCHQTYDIFGQDDDSDSTVFFMIARSDTDVIVNWIEKSFSSFSAHKAVVNEKALKNLLSRVSSKFIDLRQPASQDPVSFASFRQRNMISGTISCDKAVISKLDCVLICSHVEGKGPFKFSLNWLLLLELVHHI